MILSAAALSDERYQVADLPKALGMSQVESARFLMLRCPASYLHHLGNVVAGDVSTEKSVRPKVCFG